MHIQLSSIDTIIRPIMANNFRWRIVDPNGVRLRLWIAGLVGGLIVTGAIYSARSLLPNVKYLRVSGLHVKTHFSLRQTNITKPTGLQTRDTTFNGIRVRLYTPVLQSNVTHTLFPGLVYFHGGGWVGQSIEICDEFARQWSLLNVAVVVSVEYRLAPRFIFPIPLEDCAAATRYFILNAKQFNVHPDHIGVIGESAGGNLAACVALKLRDEGFEPSLKAQILISPVLQGIDFLLPSMQRFRQQPGMLSAKVMAKCVSSYIEGSSANQTVYFNNDHVSPAAKKQFAKTYLNVSRLPEKYRQNYTRTDMDKGDAVYYEKIKSNLLNPYFSPLVATSLTNLAPALVSTVWSDPLMDEAILYVWRLREAGNNVQHIHHDYGWHNMVSDDGNKEIKQFLWNNL